MAASRVLSRLSIRSPSLSVKIQTKTPISPSASPLKFGTSQSSQVSESMNRISRHSRLGLSSLVSMLPLHSAIASARLQSVLAAESQSWGLVPLGISMPL